MEKITSTDRVKMKKYCTESRCNSISNVQ